MSRLINRHHIRVALAAATLAAYPLGATAITATGRPIHVPVSPVATPTPTPAPSPDTTPTPPAVSGLSTTDQAQRLATLKSRGDAEINRRLTNLSAALKSAQALVDLSPANKSTLVSQLETEITGLTNLKTRLDADTTLAAARTDVQSIITEYRVYLLILPKARLVAAAVSLTDVQTRLATLESQLVTAINNAQAAGGNVTTEQTDLTDMQAKLSAVTSLTTGLTTKLLALQSSDYNADHKVLETYRTSLGTAQTDAQAARTDAANIIQALGTKTTPSVSPAASPTASSTAKPSASPKLSSTISPAATH